MGAAAVVYAETLPVVIAMLSLAFRIQHYFIEHNIQAAATSVRRSKEHNQMIGFKGEKLWRESYELRSLQLTL